jgi:UDP-N-acetylmuramate: L-alanyl-gamma-D-glutamyl-meso-diaminopimelate ligase
LGEIPLKNSDLEVINHMEGARYICQQLGILEENFYEALLTL